MFRTKYSCWQKLKFCTLEQETSCSLILIWPGSGANFHAFCGCKIEWNAMLNSVVSSEFDSFAHGSPSTTALRQLLQCSHLEMPKSWPCLPRKRLDLLQRARYSMLRFRKVPVTRYTSGDLWAIFSRIFLKLSCKWCVFFCDNFCYIVSVGTKANIHPWYLFSHVLYAPDCWFFRWIATKSKVCMQPPYCYWTFVQERPTRCFTTTPIWVTYKNTSLWGRPGFHRPKFLAFVELFQLLTPDVILIGFRGCGLSILSLDISPSGEDNFIFGEIFRKASIVSGFTNLLEMAMFLSSQFPGVWVGCRA